MEISFSRPQKLLFLTLELPFLMTDGFLYGLKGELALLLAILASGFSLWALIAIFKALDKTNLDYRSNFRNFEFQKTILLTLVKLPLTLGLLYASLAVSSNGRGFVVIQLILVYSLAVSVILGSIRAKTP